MAELDCRRTAGASDHVPNSARTSATSAIRHPRPANLDVSAMRTSALLLVCVLVHCELIGCGKAIHQSQSAESVVGLWPASSMGKWGFINKVGVFPSSSPQFDDAWYFSEGLAFVKAGDKYGYVDKTGAFVIKPRLDIASSDSVGRTIVMIARMDAAGKFIWNPRYDIALIETAVVRVGDRYGRLDGNRKFIWSPQLDKRLLTFRRTGCDQGRRRVWLPR